MNLSLDTFKKLFKIDPAKKALREFKLIQKKTTSNHKQSAKHWSSAKFVLVIVLVVVAYLQYQFYEQVNKGAFHSSAEVSPVGTSNINVDKLFSVLTVERGRSNTFAESLESGPVSFDPSRYDVVLVPTASPILDGSDSTSTQSP